MMKMTPQGICRKTDWIIALLMLWMLQMTPIAHAFNSMDEIFLHDAVLEQVFILEAAEVAVLKSPEKRIREYSHKLVKAIGHLNKRIGTLSTEKVPPGKRVELPAALSEEQMEKMKRLEEAEPDRFDRIYLETMVHAHASLIEVYRREIEYGSAGQIKEFAAHELPALEGKLAKAKKMMGEAGASR